jgi:hypothetical protein
VLEEVITASKNFLDAARQDLKGRLDPTIEAHEQMINRLNDEDERSETATLVEGQ